MASRSSLAVGPRTALWRRGPASMAPLPHVLPLLRRPLGGSLYHPPRSRPRAPDGRGPVGVARAPTLPAHARAAPSVRSVAAACEAVSPSFLALSRPAAPRIPRRRRHHEWSRLQALHGGPRSACSPPRVKALRLAVQSPCPLRPRRRRRRPRGQAPAQRSLRMSVERPAPGRNL